MSEDDINLENFAEYLENLKKNEAEQSAQASAIIQKHFENAGLPFKKWSEPYSWCGVGWELYLNINEYLREEKHSEIFKAMFAELVDFCEISTSESFEYKLKVLFEKLIESESQRDKLTRILPQKALDQFDKIREMIQEDYEDYLERSNQMGY